MKHKVFAIDFDGTIATEHEFPEAGQLIDFAAPVIRTIHDLGGIIIIWTCRSGEALDNAIDFLHKNNIPYDYVNENCGYMKDLYSNDPRKIGADIYLDDKSCFTDEYDWKGFIEHEFDDTLELNLLACHVLDEFGKLGEALG